MMYLSTLFLLLLPLSLGFADADLHSRARNRLSHRSRSSALERRQETGGRATFFDVGLGACGDWSQASDFIVALNGAQFGDGYPGPNCNRQMRISYGGKSTIATVKDKCPSEYCNYGDLDMSRGLFEFFAHQDVGVFHMTWSWADGAPAPAPPPPPPTSTWQPPPPPTSTWEAPPPPTSTWSPPPPPTSTWTPPPSPTSTWEAPSFTSSSTSTWVEPSSSSSTASSTSEVPSSSSSSASSSASSISSVGDVIASAVASSTGVPGAVQTSVVEGAGNLVLLNQVVANLGRVVVVGAQV